MLYVVILLLLFVILFSLEFFIPSGGIIGAAAAAALIAAIVVAFLESVTLGLTTLLIGMLLVPASFGLMIRIWPKTSMGKQILATPQLETPSHKYADLVGKVGRAKTDLLPSGLVEVAGRRLDAISTTGPIDRGTTIEVARIEGGRIQVRPTDKPLPNDKKKSQVGLETPVESLGLDEFEL